MNKIQKIFVMVAVGSFIVFIVSIAGRYEFRFDNGFNNMFSYRTTNADVIIQTNWLGIIAIANLFMSITGYLLFKDK